tara:strand:- start:471 stop:641 length:171 start_codon:yes stop_codon:yes gene_type:complete
MYLIPPELLSTLLVEMTATVVEMMELFCGISSFNKKLCPSFTSYWAIESCGCGFAT